MQDLSIELFEECHDTLECLAQTGDVRFEKLLERLSYVEVREAFYHYECWLRHTSGSFPAPRFPAETGEVESLLSALEWMQTRVECLEFALERMHEALCT